MMIEPGTNAPDFAARDATGATITLSQLHGSYVLVYFYPMDETAGCTAEACSLNDRLEDFEGCGAKVIGVSTQDDTSHDKFRAKHSLHFALAADTDRSIARAYGVGKQWGVISLHARVSFLVSPEGQIVKVWSRVNPWRHAADVLDAVRDLGVAADS